MTINVLGTEYTIRIKPYKSDPEFRNLAGYCSKFTKEIVICDTSTFKAWKNEPEEARHNYEKTTLRHEIAHAFLYESGLDAPSHRPDGSWADDEEIVEWIAIQGPKLYRAWKEAGAI